VQLTYFFTVDFALLLQAISTFGSYLRLDTYEVAILSIKTQMFCLGILPCLVHEETPAVSIEMFMLL